VLTSDNQRSTLTGGMEEVWAFTGTAATSTAAKSTGVNSVLRPQAQQTACTAFVEPSRFLK
jgi:hypothetical protein